jgi:glutamyl/glutaminyl-tRNA synthetase
MRHGASSVGVFRQKGYLPVALFIFLALIGWSPGEGEEVLPLPALALRFDLAMVALSGGVFVEVKLAWVYRHYLKAADPQSLTEQATPFLRDARIVVGTLSPAGTAWLVAVVPALASSIDRLSQLPERLRTVFAFDADQSLAREDLRVELTSASGRQVLTALTDELRLTARLIDRETFRALASRVKAKSGQKGKALFHPIRVVLTGDAEGPELDLLVPAIDRATELSPADGLQAVTGCRERAEAMVQRLG